MALLVDDIALKRYYQFIEKQTFNFSKQQVKHATDVSGGRLIIPPGQKKKNNMSGYCDMLNKKRVGR